MHFLSISFISTSFNVTFSTRLLITLYFFGASSTTWSLEVEESPVDFIVKPIEFNTAVWNEHVPLGILVSLNGEEVFRSE